MSGIDTAKAVLAKASLYDQTLANPDIGIAVAWGRLLERVDLDDALSAVDGHYLAETRRIMPADVVKGVRKIRAERIQRAVESVPEADADPDDIGLYLETLRAERRRLGDGESPSPMTDNRMGQKRVRELVEATAAALPSVPAVSPEERFGGFGGVA